MPKTMAQYPKRENIGSKDQNHGPYILPILSYCGILGHCFGHFGGPGKIWSFASSNWDPQC